MECNYLKYMAQRKGLDPHKIPEKQSQSMVGSDIDRKPRLAKEELE